MSKIPGSEDESSRNMNGNESPPQEGGTPQNVREITLTDKLNKRLLESFLTRINENCENSQQNTNSNDSKEEQNQFS